MRSPIKLLKDIDNKRLVEKVKIFNLLCKDRNIDMDKPHLARIHVDDNQNVIFIYEELVELNDYFNEGTYNDIASSSFENTNDGFIKQFKKLDLKNMNSVLSFIKYIDSLMDWDRITEQINISKRVLKDNNYSSFEYTQIPDDVLGAMQNDMTLEEYYEKYDLNDEPDENDCLEDEDYEIKESVVPSEKLGEGWNWHKYDDGSGHLESPDGRKYMIYDLMTNEYQITSEADYNFFPLNYFYADGVEPSMFKAFEFMEQEMIDYVLPKENEEICL